MQKLLAKLPKYNCNVPKALVISQPRRKELVLYGLLSPKNPVLGMSFGRHSHPCHTDEGSM